MKNFRPAYFIFMVWVFMPLFIFAQHRFNHDYSQTLVMKLGISVPDGKGGTNVINNFENALEIIKAANNLSLGVPKIIYLVGWQYNGHDDKYPAFFEVNKALKRPGDSNARESLIWLMNEAKQYNTVVSLHVNMTDAYENSPLWNDYVEKDMISKTAFGNLMVIGEYNNRKAYQINYKNEWNNGYAQMRIDSLLELLPPLKEAATIHIDAWIVRESKGHFESAVKEAEYQNKVLKYWNEKGIDVTSEWIMDYMIGKVPFAWHFNHFSQNDYLSTPANVYTGSGLNPDVRGTDFGLGFLFGKSMYGETVFPGLQHNPNDTTWESRFAEDFYLNCLQYFFLNKLKRLKVEGENNNRIAFFSGDVRVSLEDSTVYQNEFLLREKDVVSFPVVWKNEDCMAVYSKKATVRNFIIPATWIESDNINVFNISSKGEAFREKIKLEKQSVQLKLEAGKPILLKPE